MYTSLRFIKILLSDLTAYVKRAKIKRVFVITILKTQIHLQISIKQMELAVKL